MKLFFSLWQKTGMSGKAIMMKMWMMNSKKMERLVNIKD